MFTAIALQLGRNKDDSHQVRQEIVNFMTHNPACDAGVNDGSIVAEYGSYDNYLRRMALSSTWGDGLVLAAAVQLYQRPITIVPQDGRTFNIDGPSLPPSAVSMYLGYTGSDFSKTNNHYISLKPMPEKVCNEDPQVTASFTTASDFVSVNGDLDLLAKALQKNSSAVKTKGTKSSGTDFVSKRKREFPWIIPNGDGDGGALCKTCSTFYSNRPLPRNSDGLFIIKSFNNWKKSTGSESKNNKLLKHELSDTHTTAATLTGEQTTMSKQGRTVYSMVKHQSATEKLTNLERMIDFTDAAYFLFKQEIPHTTNYEALLALVARLDGSHNVQNFMDSSPQNATYQSYATATELLQAVTNWLQSGIVETLQKSPFLAIMGDESTDIRTRTELSVCFRYISDGRPVETFFCLHQLRSTDSSTISNAILNLVKEHRIPLCNIYWIAFDGAANMSGRKNGVQAMLKKEMPNAHYIHCRSHLLNLAAANVANDFKPLRALFSAFNSLWKFFHNSPKKHGGLDDIQKVLDDPVLQLVRAGDTRWTSNYRAVKAIRVTLRAIVYALQEIHASSGAYRCDCVSVTLCDCLYITCISNSNSPG